MRILSLGLLTALCLALPHAAWASEAAEPTYSAAYQACEARSNGVTIALRDCAADELRRQDTALNALYRTLKAQLAPRDRLQLIKAERAWLAYRAAECEAEAGPEAGFTDYGLFADACQLRINDAHERELRLMLNTVAP
jgi:uncharacterized protein YecT (DUF1311 family)